MDHQHLRNSTTCPLCNGDKDRGLIACWRCYRTHGFRYGLEPAIAEILNDTEAAIAALKRMDSYQS